MVNNIATLRGKVKERMRPFASHAAGFKQRQTHQRVIQENLAKFNLIYPNSFHCKVSFVCQALRLWVYDNTSSQTDLLPAQGALQKLRSCALHRNCTLPWTRLSGGHVP